VAFETANQLRRRGGLVDAVILMDATLREPNALLVVLREIAACAGAVVKGAPWRRNWRRLKRAPIWLLGHYREALRYLRPVLNTAQGYALEQIDTDGRPVPWATCKELYHILWRRYKPAPLSSRGILCRADPMPHEPPSLRALDGSLGWSPFFDGGLEIVPVKGDHHEMFKSPEFINAVSDFLSGHSDDRTKNA
jgi:thioesterase domain-containing protein